MDTPNWTLRFEILEVYEGDKYDDTVISELFFDGIDVHWLSSGGFGDVEKGGYL